MIQVIAKGGDFGSAALKAEDDFMLRLEKRVASGATTKPRTPLSKEKHFFVDKTLATFEFLPLLLLMIPSAKVIHIKRDPMDTCWSCFSQHFSMGHEYSQDLNELGSFYKGYFQLMEYYQV